MTFTIFDGVTSVWTETQNTVQVTDGIFNVLLGAVTPVSALPEAGNCSLEVAVNAEPIVPKIPLVSVPYTYYADKADDADNLGGDAASTYMQSGDAAGGQLAGTYPDPSIAQMGATTGQLLQWNGSAWAPVTFSASLWTNSGSGYLYPNTPSSNTNARVYGSGYSYNVYGYAGSSYTYGVYGYTGTSYAHGVAGCAFGSYSYGVYGCASSYTGNYGVYGYGYYYGVGGYCGSYSTFGTLGSYNSGYPTGVYGYGGNYYGMYGFSYGGYYAGVYGYNSGYYGYGVYGTHYSYYGSGVAGWQSYYGYGTYGYNYYFGYGVYGGGYQNYVGVYGYAGYSSTGANYPGVYGIGYYTGVTGYNRSYYYYAALSYGSYKVFGSGSVSTYIVDEKGDQRVLHCPETPEVLFEDVGSNRLVNGYCKVRIDPLLLRGIVIDAENPLRVFVTTNGECNGVHVVKHDTYFEVVENGNGRSNVAFDWRLVANRRDFQNQRFENVGRLPEGVSTKGPVQVEPDLRKTPYEQ
jgi:hypothetical protein